MVLAGGDRGYAGLAVQQPPVMANQPLDIERALLELSAIARGQQMGREVQPLRPTWNS